MPTVIKFSNLSPSAESINVYRSSTRFNKQTKPDLYETISGDSTSYTDNNAPVNKAMYYMFGTVQNGTEVLSICIEATPQFFTGPGPQLPIAGDFECGYFGTIDSTEFASYGDVMDQIPGNIFNRRLTNNTEKWMKFAYRGKILFIPEKPMATTTWVAAYESGLVFGTDDAGPRDVYKGTPFIQDKKVSVRGEMFKIRLPTCIPRTLTGVEADQGNTPNAPVNAVNGYDRHPTSSTSIVLLGNNEWDDLIAKTMVWHNPNESGPKFDTKTGELGSDQAPWTSIVDNLFQELKTSEYIISRGINSGNLTIQPGAIIIRGATTSCSYRPVLELIR